MPETVRWRCVWHARKGAPVFLAWRATSFSSASSEYGTDAGNRRKTAATTQAMLPARGVF